MLRASLLAIIVLLAFSGFGQQIFGDPTIQFTQAQYEKDLLELANQIKKNHPKAFEFISKQAFNELVEEKCASLSDSTSLGQFHWMCQDVIASISCGHSYVWWPKNFGSIHDSLLFPLDVWTDGQKLFVTDSREESNEFRGAELLTVNGLSSSEILKALYASSSSDGDIESSKKHWINSAFPSLVAMYLNYPASYQVTIKTTQGTVKKELKKRKKQKERRSEPKECSEPLCLNFKDSAAILTIQSFDYYDDDFAEFKSFIDSSFAMINNTASINQLIIDMRGNQGGDSECGAYLIEHIANAPFCYWPRNDKAKWQLKLHQTIAPNSNRFQGKPYLLVDGGCFSTSGHVGSIIKANDFAYIVGEEMGSTYTCNDGSMFGSLKHTGIFFRIPQRTYATCSSDFPDNRGIQPDKHIELTLEDILSKKDPVMEWVLEQISK